VERADIKYVVDPVHMDGTSANLPPRKRHLPDCQHFKWSDGKILGDLRPATPEEMERLGPCKDCARRRH
jgi:hypothetical protein